MRERTAIHRGFIIFEVVDMNEVKMSFFFLETYIIFLIALRKDD